MSNTEDEFVRIMGGDELGNWLEVQTSKSRPGSNNYTGIPITVGVAPTWDDCVKAVKILNAAYKIKIDDLEKALKFYARRYDKEGKCWNWNTMACDSYSGAVEHFDYEGDEADEPWEIAEKALELK